MGRSIINTFENQLTREKLIRGRSPQWKNNSRKLETALMSQKLLRRFEAQYYE